MVTQYSQQNDCVRVQNKVCITKIIVHIITNDCRSQMQSKCSEHFHYRSHLSGLITWSVDYVTSGLFVSLAAEYHV